MKKRSLKLLSLAMSGVLTFSSLGSMTAFAASGDDFSDWMEEYFEAFEEHVSNNA
ncbi:MAG: hypothetical protein IKH46_01075 [Lachnospiraceae bacterium]|nr:hypothetical protein [Lachnospiraceae bacterium]